MYLFYVFFILCVWLIGSTVRGFCGFVLCIVAKSWEFYSLKIRDLISNLTKNRTITRMNEWMIETKVEKQMNPMIEQNQRSSV